MSEHESPRARATRHAALYERALTITRARWGRNRSSDEIEDAVSEAYRTELACAVKKGLDLDEKSGHWIMRRAVHLLTGKCAGRSRRVLCSATHEIRSARTTSDHVLADNPGDWIEQQFHDTLQADASAIESGIVDHVDLEVRIERLLTGAENCNGAGDAFRILLDLGFETGEIAACLGTLSRQAVNLWKHSGRVPLVYQERLIALVMDREPLHEQRDISRSSEPVQDPPSDASPVAGVVGPMAAGTVAGNPRTPRHGARVRRHGALNVGSAPSRT